MAQMTEKRNKMLKSKLRDLKDNYEQAVKEKMDAKEKGDLSENEEYATASRVVMELSHQIESIEEELSSAEIVGDDRSPRITIGSRVAVCRVDDDGNAIGEERQFTVDSRGSTILDGVLGVQSSLGKIILNGMDGIYKIPDNGGISYSVRKVF